MNDILLRIRELITEKNLSDSAFAKRIGLTQSTFSNFFQRNSIPKANIMKNISNEYGVNLNWLITGEGEMFLSARVQRDDPTDPPDGFEQRLVMLDHLLNLLIEKGFIEESDIPHLLPGAKRANYADKMSDETYRMLQRQLARIQREAKRAQRGAEYAQQETERIKKEMKRYEARYSESDEVSEPEQEYESRESIALNEPVAAKGEVQDSYEAETSVSIPLVGRIAAGPPLDTESWPDDWVRILSRRGESPDTHYLLEVTGTSMGEAGISHGSLILIRRAEIAESGQIAVIYLPDEGVTLKRVSHNPEGQINLEWQDGSGRSRKLNEGDLIQGVFVRVVNE